MLDAALADLRTLADAVLALALGGVVGWERERKGKGAGLRTMMLVALSSFLFVEVSVAAGAAAGGGVRVDPVRAVQAIAAGLGFLGAGIVFRDRERDRTRGLTTAASLLVVAPIGIAVALDRYVLAVGATVLTVLVLGAAERLERRVELRRG
ncbi:MgtC/SapB family protein [Rubrivirga sp. S365]|uniref:MgtC/SapB family protein n=1 Tax=Rubrivirga litoralis TaxID=3075598 RepID=A0ABU3BM21_9BACT|nr:MULTISPECIES: MgtC/SapB family protein [unclassified Rubrivirga]MDT0630313.1 MgtC/SapB family protein [Rubrivirga sp. F394]MDT7855825.1 MgtC/SapB family protein [Rubrivirga sp. S365]